MRVVFVHGACVPDGAWWWHRTAELLLERGVPSVAPPLPSCGEGGTPGGAGGPGLPEDVAAVRQVLQDGNEPTVVVAHSYGGIVTAEAAAGVGSVRHLLLVSSYLPEVGQSLCDFGDGTPASFLDVDPDSGTFGVRPDGLAAGALDLPRLRPFRTHPVRNVAYATQFRSGLGQSGWSSPSPVSTATGQWALAMSA